MSVVLCVCVCASVCANVSMPMSRSLCVSTEEGAVDCPRIVGVVIGKRDHRVHGSKPAPAQTRGGKCVQVNVSVKMCKCRCGSVYVCKCTSM